MCIKAIFCEGFCFVFVCLFVCWFVLWKRRWMCIKANYFVFLYCSCVGNSLAFVKGNGSLLEGRKCGNRKKRREREGMIEGGNEDRFRGGRLNSFMPENNTRLHC